MEQTHILFKAPALVVSRLCLCCILGTLAGILHAADSVIYYNSIPTLTTPAALRRVNADGSGDQAVAVNLPAGLYPTASRDGRRLLLTSQVPGRPFKISNDVFTHEIATAATSRITSFEDILTTQGLQITNDLGQTIGDRINSGYTINYPYHKAFSPDGSRVVVMNLLKRGTVSRDTINSITNGPGELGAISERFPAVEIYRVADARPEGSYVYLGVARTGFNQGGDGVDWHPTRNEIVATLSSDIPATGNAGRTSMEGTKILVFTASAPSEILRQLTGPTGRADFFLDASTLIATASAQHDYAPAISSDGQRVAYVRHTLRQDTRYDGAGIAPLPAQCSIHVINYDGTDDREVLPNGLHLADGLWVTKVAWSPDGSQIAFDLAPQVVLNGLNSLLGDVTRSEVYIMNVDGTSPRRLAQTPASFPTWAPGATIGGGDPPPQPVIIRAIHTGNIFELDVDQIVPGRLIRIEGTIDLRSWGTVFDLTASATSQTISFSPIDPSGMGFYRVRAF